MKKEIRHTRANPFKEASILVTGANGQLGLTIKELFEVNNDNIDFTFVTKSELDITDEERLKQYFNLNHFDYCINCAAYTNVEQAEKNPEIAYRVNAEGVKYLAEACNENNVVLIHISTDYVFDGEKTEPYTTEDKPNPINEYGKSKLLGEQYIQAILDEYFIIRTSWLYSKKYGNNFYKTILKKAKTGEALFVTDEQIGCPTDTVSLSHYIIKLALESRPDFGIHHFCDSEEMSWYGFAKQILKGHDLFDQTVLVRTENYRTFAARPKRSVLKIFK